jgi:hypothetical protein
MGTAKTNPFLPLFVFTELWQIRAKFSEQWLMMLRHRSKAAGNERGDSQTGSYHMSSAITNFNG